MRVAGSATMAALAALFVETTTPLGGNITFTGPLRDTIGFRAGSWNFRADVAGTADVDVADDQVAAPTTYNGAALSASPGARGAPATFVGFQMNINTTNIPNRYARAVMVNGAGAQAAVRVVTYLTT